MKAKNFLLLFLLSEIGVNVYAIDWEAKIDGICYKSNYKGVYVVRDVTNLEPSMYSGDIVIPDSVTYQGITYPVKYIESHAFAGSGITSICTPSTLLQTEYGAFSRCKQLRFALMHGGANNDVFYGCEDIDILLCINNPSSWSYGLSSYTGRKGFWRILIPEEEGVDAVTFFRKKYEQQGGSYPCSVDTAFYIREITQSTITLSSTPHFTIHNIQVGSTIFNAIDGDVKITNLTPEKEYSLKIRGVAFGREVTCVYKVYTKELKWECSPQITNTTITVKGTIIDAGDADVTDIYWQLRDKPDEDLGHSDQASITGLAPGSFYALNLIIKFANGDVCKKEYTFTTLPVKIGFESECTATHLKIKAVFKDLIDATPKSIKIEPNNPSGYPSYYTAYIERYNSCDYGQNEIIMRGLEPNNYPYNFKCTATFEEGGKPIQGACCINTSYLELSTLPPKVVSEGNVIVAGDSNIDDDETNVGFEWRRTDWTDDFPSNSSKAYLYEGRMEGYIRNMNANYLWKCRAYYESNAGNRYYGDWIGIDPSNTSYFEPTVHTYANVNVNGNSAEVKGYALRGTDNVTEQGFMFWETESYVKATNQAPMRANVPTNAKTVTVASSGQIMTVTLIGLNPNTQYTIVAFVKTSEGETFYGEEKTFTTGEGSGTAVEDLQPSSATIVARYDTQGRRLTSPQRGLNILRMSDGTSRKVIVK